MVCVFWIFILLVSCAGEEIEELSWGALGAGSAHSCMVPRDRILRCWGANDSGQLGNRRRMDYLRPVGVHGGNIQALAMGYAHTCAIDDGGALFCWGDNSFGQLGVRDQSGRLIPGKVDFGEGRTVKAVAAGHIHTCAILNDNTLVCWGFNGSGQLGNGSTDGSFAPIGVNLGKGKLAKEITAGFSHTCVLLDEHSIKCWGGNGMGQLGGRKLCG